MGSNPIIPWWGKIAAKVILSRIPLGYHIWRKLALFKHGAMHQPDYALNVFNTHYQRAHASLPSEFCCLELGPGDSLYSAVIATCYGSSKTYLVDSGAFASVDLLGLKEMASFCQKKGLAPTTVDDCMTTETLLKKCHATYLTDGLSSIKEIPDQSVDFIWSNAVLEHIRHSQFMDLQRELRRILKPNGICSHQVDLRDHLGGALNNLRFSHKLWEKEWMAQSGFYTNRIRFSHMTTMFRDAGFDVKVLDISRWEQLPTPRDKFNPEFSTYSDDDLKVSGFDVVLRPT